MFLAKPGEFEACGMYTKGHFILLIISIVGILISIYYTKNKKSIEITKIIRRLTVFLWILEIIKIIFNFAVGNVSNPNTYIPLYFCSIILYAGIFCGYGKGKLKHFGDVFIATGGMIAGIFFLLTPMTSLTIYPAIHYISIQSFIFHSVMVYLGILVNITGYIEIDQRDILYYSSLMIIMSLIALIFNLIFDSNLMFISKDYPGTIMSLLFNSIGSLFTPFMIILQATAPFYIVYLTKLTVYKLVSIKKHNQN